MLIQQHFTDPASWYSLLTRTSQSHGSSSSVDHWRHRWYWHILTEKPTLSVSWVLSARFCTIKALSFSTQTHIFWETKFCCHVHKTLAIFHQSMSPAWWSSPKWLLLQHLSNIYFLLVFIFYLNFLLICRYVPACLGGLWRMPAALTESRRGCWIPWNWNCRQRWTVQCGR